MDEYVEKYIKMITDGCTLGCYLCDNSRYEETIFCKVHEMEYRNNLCLEIVDSKGIVVDKSGNYYLENDKGVLKGINYLKRTSNIEVYKKEMPSKLKQTGGENVDTTEVRMPLNQVVLSRRSAS